MADKMTIITLERLGDFAGELKKKYVGKDELTAVDARVKALEAVKAEANVLEGVNVNGEALKIAEKMVDILIATGTANGSIKVNGKDVSVAGLAALAYKAEITEEELSTALKQTLANKAAKSELDALSGQVETLIGNEDGDDEKSVREISAEEVAKIVADADESYDTLKEIADWIMSDTTGAAKMANDITALKSKLTLGSKGDSGEYSTVKEYVEAVVSGFISLTALDAKESGTGNVVTGFSYDKATGEFTATKGTMVSPVTPSATNNIAVLTSEGQLADGGKGISAFVLHDEIEEATAEAVKALLADE